MALRLLLFLLLTPPREVLTLPVLQPDGTPLPNPVITILGSTPAPSFEARCTLTGHCRVSSLAPGLYTLSIRAAGYPEKQIPNVRVVAGQPLDLGAIQLDPPHCGAPGVLCDGVSLDAPIHRRGTFELPFLCAADFDEGQDLCSVELDGRGSIPPLPDAVTDLWLQPVNRRELAIRPRNRAALALHPLANWTRQSCAQAAFSSKPLKVDPSAPGTVFCLRSSQGRISQFVLLPDKDPAAEKVRIIFTTWQ